MITLKIDITETNGGIGVELNAEPDQPTPQEKLFAQQFGKTISDFLNNAPKTTANEGD
jgi:hypothetical protein